MKQESPPLRAFIRDYHLEKEEGLICFTASIHFHAEHAWFKFVSQVNVVTITFKHLDVIYLLNPEIDKLKIKTMFTNNHRFVYSRTRQFMIEGLSKKYGHYTLEIIPINNNCGEPVIGELKAKMYN